MTDHNPIAAAALATVPADVTEAVERLARLDRLGHLAETEDGIAPDVRTVLAFVASRYTEVAEAFMLGWRAERRAPSSLTLPEVERIAEALDVDPVGLMVGDARRTR